MSGVINANERIPIEWHDAVESTQVLARGRIEGGLDTARGYAARVQTLGYGRHGRVWQSPEGGLWMTVALLGVTDQSLASAGVRVGGAIGGIVERLVDRRLAVSVKWPNDVLIDDRKVCGVLCESLELHGRRWLLVGVGMNVNNAVESLAGHLRRPAAALREWVGGAVDLRALAEEVAQRVAGALRGSFDRRSLEWTASRLWKLDAAVTVRHVDGRRERALIRGLDESGGLVVEVDGRRTRLALGAEIEDESNEPGAGT